MKFRWRRKERRKRRKRRLRRRRKMTKNWMEKMNGHFNLNWLVIPRSI